MLQEMDHMAASCIFYVELGMIHQREESKICIFTFTKIEIVMLAVQHYFIFILHFI